MEFRYVRVGLLLIVGMVCGACQPRGSAQNPAAQVAPTAVPTIQPASLVGRPIKDDQHAGVYLLDADGRVRLIRSLPVFNALGYQFQDIENVSVDQLRTYPTAMPITRWLTGVNDHRLYVLEGMHRYPIDGPILAATGGSVFDVSPVPDAFLASYPIVQILPDADRLTALADTTATNRAFLWVGDSLWIAHADGLLRWNPVTGATDTFAAPSNVAHLVLLGQTPTAITRDGKLWTFDGSTWSAISTNWGQVQAVIAFQDALWFGDTSYYDTAAGEYHIGRGLVRRGADGKEETFTQADGENDVLKYITALAGQGGRLWVGTRFSGLFQLDITARAWTRYSTATSSIPDNNIHDLTVAPDGALWIVSDSGVSRFADDKFELYPLPDAHIEQQPVKIGIGPDTHIWTAGADFIARLESGKNWHVETPFSDIRLLDSWQNLSMDAQGAIWALGEKSLLKWDGKTWTAYDGTTLKPVSASAPREFPLPSPQVDYSAWLRAWPRPAEDNGLGIHYLASPTGETFELRQQMARLQKLHLRWLVVNYTNRAQLFTMAPAFAKLGLMVIWRPFVRPYMQYPYWAEDVQFLRALGIAPYIQIYNEPSLGQEWQDAGKSVDQGMYLTNLLPAIKQVYDAGGFVGIQELTPAWVKEILTRLKAQNMSNIFVRMFFVPHAYGYNHPPEFDKDINSVLGFREFAAVFQAEIGFVPVMIAGEGGWRPGEQQDARYSQVTLTRHRDYLLAVFGWFQTGKLSNGEPLPDYFLAFCPWILSDQSDGAAWFDSIYGSRDLVIQAVGDLPPFIRKFSWDAR